MHGIHPTKIFNMNGLRQQIQKINLSLEDTNDNGGRTIQENDDMDASEEQDKFPMTMGRSNSAPLNRPTPRTVADATKLYASTGHLGVPRPSPGMGGRTKSTQTRLKRQGFEPMRRESSVNFVVKSIRRGTDEWGTLIRPFVADLAFKSLVKPRYYSVPRFQAYECHAAVLFVDLSGYSKITSALAEKGAHAISNEVNDYLGQLLRIIHSYGGDVVKFAGDAVMVVWEGSEDELGMNVLASAVCVLELQDKAGCHPIMGTDLFFKIHCGLACGILESEVFQAKHAENMQQLYHSVGGDPVDEIGELVELAAAGEICVSRDCLDYLDQYGEFRNVDDSYSDASILKKLNLKIDMLERIDDHVMKVLSARLSLRTFSIEEDFIHPSVLKLLCHGGLSPTQIAQMRNLCVLFIAMVANGSSVNWLTEVQTILDRHRCPIVQIIDDDKGVHLVGAINLYEAIPEAALLGLQICEELQERQVGCAIGMAKGSTFCGVTGSSSIACRWDIVGPPAVRAARLMQYAIRNGHEFVLDDSIYQDRMTSSRLTLLHEGIEIKGTKNPCPIYTLSTSKKSAALHILETVHGSVHDDQVRAMHDMLTHGDSCKRTIVITGPPQSGKKIAAQRAAGYADLTPFLHVSSESAGHLQLARTIATWYKYVDDEDVQSGAMDVLEHLDARRWSRAHDTCIEMINLAVTLGLRACFIVDRIQFLDEFSCSLIRECLHVRRTKHRRELNHQWSSRVSAVSESSENEGTSTTNGVVCFLCVHVAFYQYPNAQDTANRLSRTGARVKVPVVTLGRVTTEDLRLLFRDLSDMEVDYRWIETYGQSSGYCAGYFVERAAASRLISGLRWSKGLPGLAITNQDMALQIPHGMLRVNGDISVHQVSADVAMKYTQLYDELPVLFQTFLKVLTMATRGGYFAVPMTTMWQVLNDLIDEGVERETFDTVVEEMTELFFVTFKPGCTGEPAMQLVNPAIADIAYDVCTPDQLDTICMALLDRMESMVDAEPIVPFVMASFYQRLGNNEHAMIHLWRKGYSMLLEMRQSVDERKFNMFLETIDADIRDSGLDTLDVLGKDFSYQKCEVTSIGSNLPMCKVYMGPITLGTMGQSVTVLCRNIFHEMKNFRVVKPSVKRRLLGSYNSAAERYCKEAQVIENFLAEYNLDANDSDLQQEFSLVVDIAHPASSPEQVQSKGARMLQEFIPKYVTGRRDRLLQMYQKVRQCGGVPWPLQDADPTLKKSFEALQAGRCLNETVHDALMVLAVNHWKPKRVTELLPLIHHQTVARLRTKALRRLSEAEMALFRHQQGPEDLGAFLIITALLHKAGQKENWYM